MDIIFLAKTSMLMVIQLSTPPLVAAIVAGVLISLVQTVFSIQDQTLPFTVKLVSVASILAATGGWIGSSLIGLVETVFTMMPDI